MSAVWAKLLIPLGIGIGAAVLHWQAIGQAPPTAKFVRVKQSLKTGTVIEADALEEVTITGTQETVDALKLTAIPWQDRGVIVGRPAPRNLKKNDILFLQDTWSFDPQLSEPWAPLALDKVDVQMANLSVGSEVTFKVPIPPKEGLEGPALPKGFEQLGPFRVLAVGTRLSRVGSDGKTEAVDKTIAIAVKYDSSGKLTDPDYDKLLAALAAAQRNAQIRIAIAVNPNPPERKPDDKSDPKKK